MPANLIYHAPIYSVETTTGLTPFTGALPEKAGQVFKFGVPLQSNGGYAQQWDGATVSGGIIGFSLTQGSNLSTNGAGAPGGFGQITGTGSLQTYGNVANMPNAVNIALGSPMVDGRALFEVSIGNTIFEATFDNSTGGSAASYTPTPAMFGTQFGLTQDVSGQFYIDAGKTIAGTNTVAILVGINPIDMSLTPNVYNVNARVRFQVLATARQLFI